jgi:hypothetical protein
MDGKRPTNIVQANAEVTKLYPYPTFKHQSSASLFSFVINPFSFQKEFKFHNNRTGNALNVFGKARGI